MIIRHKNKLLILAGLFVVMLTTGLGCKGGDSGGKAALEKPVTLEFWGVFDDSTAYQPVIDQYRQSRPNVDIKYKKLQFGEYERALLDAWAEGRGPDIFMVHNTWIGAYENKIKPMPEKIKVPTIGYTGTVKKEKTVIFKDVPTITPGQINNIFISVVPLDVIRGGKIYGLPLSVDTLALYYNRRLFDQSGVVNTPRTWQEVKNASLAIAQLNDDQISRSGIALGGADNINRSFDIVSLLMAQNGTEFVSIAGDRALFHRGSSLINDDRYLPGQEAFRFYTDFANPAKEVYNWSEDLPSAYESFIAGRLAMMPGYAYQLPLLRAQGPKINLGIAPIPHINADGTDALGESVNWANYWVLSMAQSSEHENEVWDFIQYITTQPEVASGYLNVVKRPSALRSVVGTQTNDPDIGVFASQALTARSWYRGKNPQAAEQAYKQAITDIIGGFRTVEEAVTGAAQTISQTLR